MAGKTSRNRVVKDRLWDAGGREWSGALGRWASAEDVTALLAAGVPVVVHGYGREFRTLSSRDAATFWSAARNHFQVPGLVVAVADREGRTYAAQVWSRGSERLLGFVEFC